MGSQLGIRTSPEVTIWEKKKTSYEGLITGYAKCIVDDIFVFCKRKLQGKDNTVEVLFPILHKIIDESLKVLHQ